MCYFFFHSLRFNDSVCCNVKSAATFQNDIYLLLHKNKKLDQRKFYNAD